MRKKPAAMFLPSRTTAISATAGLGGQTVLFVPKETLRPGQSPQEPGHPDDVTLAINYPFLETMQKVREQPAH
ncbi:MAG: hypothetical protein ABIU05_17025, partial [Nitrospirales bacterium]